MSELTDEDVRAYWRRHGGEFYGPKYGPPTNNGGMPEAELLPLLRRLLESGRKANRLERTMIQRDQVLTGLRDRIASLQSELVRVRGLLDSRNRTIAKMKHVKAMVRIGARSGKR